MEAFFESLRGRHERYFAAARRIRESVVFTGRLEHGELARILPATEAVVVPSMFPEAFGMVAAEAAACGALPVCAAHSGLAEVAEALEPAYPEDLRHLAAFETGAVVIAKIQVDGLAVRAAEESGVEFGSTRSTNKARATAEHILTLGGAELVDFEVLLREQIVRVTARKRASTLVVHRIGPLKKHALADSTHDGKIQ
jgi:glycosyltransferase involved in cell wall biosynthesis